MTILHPRSAQALIFAILFTLTACGSSTRDVKICPTCAAPTERNSYDFMHGGFMTTERHCPACGWNK